MLFPKTHADKFLDQIQGMLRPAGRIIQSHGLLGLIFQGCQQTGERSRQVIVKLKRSFFFQPPANGLESQFRIGQSAGTAGFHFDLGGRLAHGMPFVE